MERLIAQDPMLIATSSRGVMHTTNTAQTGRAEYCEKARMAAVLQADRA